MATVQAQLFSESLREALDELVHALGPKRVGAALWPALPIKDAARKVANCLNAEHQQKLDLEEIDHLLAMGRDAGLHVVPAYIGQRFHYRVEPIALEELEDEAVTAVEHAARALQEATSMLAQVREDRARGERKRRR